MTQFCVQPKVDAWAAANNVDVQSERSFVQIEDPTPADPNRMRWVPRRIYDSGRWSGARMADSRRPDFVNVDTQSIVEVKLYNPVTGRADVYGPGQRQAYEEIAEQNTMDFEEVDTRECECPDEEGEEETAPANLPEIESLPLILRLLQGLGKLRPPIYIPPGGFRPVGPGGFRPQLA